MVENEPLPSIPKADAPEPSHAQILVKRLFDEHPPGEFQEILRVGYTGLDAGDTILAKACADHVLSRAQSGSGDTMRAMILRARVYERFGNNHQHDALLHAVIEGQF